MHYLKTAVRGDAASKISIFSVVGENYKAAWNLLEKSYDNKRLIVSRHLHLLLNLPKIKKTTVENMCQLADFAQQHVKCLDNLGIQVCPEIVVQILEERLPKFLVAKWDETPKRDEMPNLDNLIEFIYGAAARLSFRSIPENQGNPHAQKGGSKEFSSKTSKETVAFKRQKYEPTNNRVLLSSQKILKCKVCNKAHPLFRCEKFRKLSVNERYKVVKEAGLCKNCMREADNHDCKFRGCLVCNKKHNTMLHNTNIESSTKNKNL